MRSRVILAVLMANCLTIDASTSRAQSYSDIILAGEPLLYWSFNEPGDADPAVDLVSAVVGNSLLPEGNATRVASTSTSGGLSLGRSASFDGAQLTKFYSGALTPPTNPDAWALEMWVRAQGPDPGDRFDYLLEARAGAVNFPGILFDYGNNDVVEVYTGGRTGNAGPSLVNDTWHHLVIGSFGTAVDRVDFFLDGAPAGSVAFAASSPFGTDQIAVGNSVPGHPDFDAFMGQIDELAIYDLTGMTAAQIENKLDVLASHSAISAPSVVGDANNDGVVNGADFELISENLFTTQAAGGGGDLDFDGLVDFADYRIWKNAAPPEIVAQYAIPEPSTLTLASLAALGLARRRRRA